MKKVLLLSVIALASCGKFKFENKIQGTWQMKEIKLHDQSVWFNVPSNEQAVTITKDSVSNPWSDKYMIVDKHTIVINNTFIDVDIKKKSMLWVSNGDSIKFVR